MRITVMRTVLVTIAALTLFLASTPFWVATSLGVWTILFVVLHLYLNRLDRIQTLQKLRGFARQLIRQIENNPTTTPKETRTSRNDQLDQYIELWKRTNLELPVMSLPYITSDLTLPAPPPGPAAMDPRSLLEMHESFSGDFWGKVQGLRNGALILIILLGDRNPLGAKYALDEHIRQKKPQPFQELRDVLQLSWRRCNTLTQISAGDVFRDMDYRPFNEDRVYHGEYILDGFRIYVR